jgi:spore coat polysaccharide biosynthesis protein SpsF (cytidylyltransferase family)
VRLSTRIISAALVVLGTVMMAAVNFGPSIVFAADADAAPLSQETTSQPKEEDLRVVAVLFSVGQTENAIKQFREVPNIDLLDVNGEPMISHVYKALRASKYIDKIVVVAAAEVGEALNLQAAACTTFLEDKGDAAENVQFGIDQVATDDLVMFVPSDLVLVTTKGLDRLIERVMAEKDADIFFPLVSREICEEKYPEERRTYARFKEGQYTGAHIEFLRPKLFLDNADQVEAQKDKLYDVYYMRKNTLGVVRFLGIKLTLKYIFGSLSPSDVEEHVFDKYSVTAKTLYWDDPDLSTDLSEPNDIKMIQRVLEQRESKQSQIRPANDGSALIKDEGSSGV